MRALGSVRLRAASPGFGLRFDGFAVEALDGCLAALADPRFAERIDTDELTVPQVAERVAQHCGLSLDPDTNGHLRGRVRRALVSLRHVRLP